MGAQQVFQAALHGAHLQRNRHMGAEMAIQGAGMGRVVDAIGVPLARRVKPGVKRHRDVPPVQHADVGGQTGIQRKGEFLRRNAAGSIEMHPLPQRVNARVRPAGAGHGQRFLAGQLLQGFLQHLLHRQCVLLALPASVGRAIVADGQ